MPISGSEVNISGGRITNLVANSGSVVNFFGGGDSTSIFRANEGSVLNLFGNFGFRALFIEADGQMNIFGHDFSLNDVPLDGLVAGVPFEITDRGNLFLTGLLLDGESFRYFLRAADPAATITVTLVPEPSPLLLTLFGAFLVSTRVQRCTRRVADFRNLPRRETPTQIGCPRTSLSSRPHSGSTVLDVSPF